MRTKPTDATLVTFSIRAYRLLLAAYPSEFRQEYGPHMLQLFRDYSIRRYKQNGASGMFSLWAITLFDFLRSVIEEHLQRETIMNKDLFIRLSGWALILGGVAFSLGITGAVLAEIRFYPFYSLFDIYDVAFEFGMFFVGPPLIAVGLIGLLVRFGGGFGNLVRVVILIGAIAGAFAIPLAFLAEEIANAMSIDGDGAWIWTFAVGLMLMFGSLALFGILAVRHKAMPHWNGLPIIAGLWFPTLLLLSTILTGSFLASDDFTTYLPLLTVPIFAAAMILPGYMLQADTATEPAMA
jgi:hypothetical protein